MSDLTDKLGSLIPAFFYDLISRIIPGATILTLLFVLELPGGKRLAELHMPDALGFVVALGASYVLGLLITPPATLLGAIVWFPLRRVSQQYRLPSPLQLWTRIDDLRRKNDEPKAATLTKMAAEITMADNLLVGLLGLLILSLRFSTHTHLGLLSAASAAALVNVLFRRGALAGRVLPEISPTVEVQATSATSKK